MGILSRHIASNDTCGDDVLVGRADSSVYVDSDRRNKEEEI